MSAKLRKLSSGDRTTGNRGAEGAGVKGEEVGGDEKAKLKPSLFPQIYPKIVQFSRENHLTRCSRAGANGLQGRK